MHLSDKGQIHDMSRYAVGRRDCHMFSFLFIFRNLPGCGDPLLSSWLGQPGSERNMWRRGTK